MPRTQDLVSIPNRKVRYVKDNAVPLGIGFQSLIGRFGTASEPRTDGNSGFNP